MIQISKSRIVGLIFYALAAMHLFFESSRTNLGGFVTVNYRDTPSISQSITLLSLSHTLKHMYNEGEKKNTPSLVK